MKLLACLPVGTELVIGGTLLRVLQHLIGLTHFLEARLRIRLLADIRVIFTRKLAIGALDSILGGVTLDPDDLVVIPVFHDLLAMSDHLIPGRGSRRQHDRTGTIECHGSVTLSG
jgi:hypothetical protein